MCNHTTNTISSCSKKVEQALKNSTGVQIGHFYIEFVEKPKNEFLMVIWIISDSTAFLCSKMYVLMAGCCAVSSRKSKGCDAESALQLCQVLVPGKHAFVGSQ